MIKRLFKPLAASVGLIALAGSAFFAGGYSQSAFATARNLQPSAAAQPAQTIASHQDDEAPSFFFHSEAFEGMPEGMMGFAEGFDLPFGEMLIDDAQAADEPGIVIVRVDKDSPAAKAGIKRGDIVLKIGETEINTPRATADIVSKVKIGDSLKLTVQHGDDIKTFNVTVGDKNGRPYLGIAPLGGQNVRIVRGGGIVADGKIKVSQVVTDGPAAKAGIKAGDVIVEIDGKKLNQPLPAIIAAHKPGDVIKVKVERGSESSELSVTLGENPDKKGVAYLGVMFTPAMPTLPPGLPNPPGPPGGPRNPGGNGPRFPLPGIPGGPGSVISGTQVIVANVTPDSPADKAGIKRGNVIEAIDGVKVTDPKSVTDAIAAHKPGDVVKISIRKQGDSAATDISVTLGERADDKTKAFLGVALNFTRSIRQGAPRQSTDPQG